MMDFDFLGSIAGIGWRDIVLVLAALVGVYLVLSVMRLFQVGGKRNPAPELGHAAAAEPALGAPRAAGEIATAEPGFADELARTTVEGELQRLRREGVQLREELARLSEEVARLKATRNVSPLYNEAMSLAQQGMPANGIAGHCGISIGEAELVAALARGEPDFEQQDQDLGEDSDERNPHFGNRAFG